MAKVLVGAVVGGMIGGAVGFAVKKLYLDNLVSPSREARDDASGSLDGLEDIAYSYEEAVAKAKAKMEAQREAGVPEDEIDDRVKFVAPGGMREAGVNEAVEYNKVIEEGRYVEKQSVWDNPDTDPRPKPSQDPESYSEGEPEKTEVEEWPDEKAGRVFRISEDEFQYGSPWHEKLEGGQFFKRYNILCGWDGDPDPIFDDELVGRCAYAASNGEAMVFLRDPEDERDMSIVVIDDNWHDTVG